jgi:SAM-dependent methyltransferase
MPKTYDRQYFDRWYRSKKAVTSFAELRRKVTMVITMAEFFLRRPLKNVLDVGCGEAPWFVHVKALRPRASYIGIDPSEYTVRVFGTHRNVKPGSFNDLSAATGAPFDLVVCADVMHYLSEVEIRTGLPPLVEMMRGVAFIEVFTKEDRVSGDFDGMHRRRARWYRELFANEGLTAVGPYLWLAPARLQETASLETAR